MYNEVVLDAHVWTRHLPATVEAVYYLAHSGLSSALLALALAAEMTARYAHELGARAVSVLRLDPESVDAPFAPLGGGGSGEGHGALLRDLARTLSAASGGRSAKIPGEGE